MQISRLRLFPSAAGMQHCEIACLRDTIEERISAWYVPQRVYDWARDQNRAVKDRERPGLGVALHHNVEDRLEMDEVDQCDGRRTYHPQPPEGRRAVRASVSRPAEPGVVLPAECAFVRTAAPQSAKPSRAYTHAKPIDAEDGASADITQAFRRRPPHAIALSIESSIAFSYCSYELFIVGDEPMAMMGFQRHDVAREDRASVTSVAHALASNGSVGLTFEVTEADGRRRQVNVPPQMAQAFRSLADSLARNGSATVVDEDEEISPEKAAELLGVSRPTVVQRINQGQLRGRMVGAHHRIRMSDLLAFREGEQDRALALEEFGEQTDEMTSRHGF